MKQLLLRQHMAKGDFLYHRTQWIKSILKEEKNDKKRRVKRQKITEIVVRQYRNCTKVGQDWDQNSQKLDQKLHQS